MMNTNKMMTTEMLTFSRMVSPEDLKPGDYVTISKATYEMIPTVSDESWKRNLEPMRIEMTHYEAGRPLKILQVCVPFVLAKKPNGKHCTLDLRRHHLARLSAVYGKMAFKCLENKKKKK